MNASRCAEALRIKGIGEIAARYDLFLIDQWGTIHDGYKPLTGAAACLTRLVMLAKRIALLSNSSQRTRANRDRLREIGLDERFYSCVVTSGELIWQALARRDDPAFAALGEKCYLLSRDGTSPLLDGLDLACVDDPGDASFVLIAGVAPGKRIADYRGVLEACAARALPAVCANPDRIGVDGEDRPAAPGALAHLYETMGQRVLYRGKPEAAIYTAAIEKTGVVDPRRILAIGDSLEHDIAGGMRRGFDSLLVTGGLHAEELGGDAAGFETRLDAAVAQHRGERPTYVIDRFQW
jgi:HAD superfamily hydrolase (TIGR01459 family)